VHRPPVDTVTAPDVTPVRPIVVTDVTVRSIPAPGTVWVARPVAVDQAPDVAPQRPVTALAAIKPPEVASTTVVRSGNPPAQVLTSPPRPVVTRRPRWPPPVGRTWVDRTPVDPPGAAPPSDGVMTGAELAAATMHGHATTTPGTTSAVFGSTSPVPTIRQRR
jgi:hypothetical protein